MNVCVYLLDTGEYVGDMKITDQEWSEYQRICQGSNPEGAVRADAFLSREERDNFRIASCDSIYLEK